MIKFSENKLFKYKVLFGFGLFLITQIISYKVHYLDRMKELDELCKNRGICIDVIHTFGFPLPLLGSVLFNFVAMAVNLVVSIVFIFIICFVIKFIQSKISTRSNKLK